MSDKDNHPNSGFIQDINSLEKGNKFDGPSSLPNQSIIDSLANNNYNLNICEICYVDNNTIYLDCCHRSKKICYQCLDCLKVPICPWCRQTLPVNLQTKTMQISQSCPESYDDYLASEIRYLLINPYDPDYQDSRILRRALRNIRHNYHHRSNRNLRLQNNYRQQTNQSYRQINRRQNRQQTRQQLNQISNDYNNELINLEDTIFRIDL